MECRKAMERCKGMERCKAMERCKGMGRCKPKKKPELFGSGLNHLLRWGGDRGGGQLRSPWRELYTRNCCNATEKRDAKSLAGRCGDPDTPAQCVLGNEAGDGAQNLKYIGKFVSVALGK